jgi:hypothetical protein
MARFCEECPSRGECLEEIKSYRIVASETHGSVSDDRTTASFSFVDVVPQGSTDMMVEYVDVDSGSSKPLAFSGSSYEAARAAVVNFAKRVDNCSGPEEVKKWAGLVTKKICSA